MIPHHAHHALPNLQDPALNALALGIIGTQSKEIGEMHALRSQIPQDDLSAPQGTRSNAWEHSAHA